VSVTDLQSKLLQVAHVKSLTVASARQNADFERRVWNLLVTELDRYHILTYRQSVRRLQSGLGNANYC